MRTKLEKSYRSCRRNRWGAAVVEFAVVSPVFFLLVFGMIEYGRLVMVQQLLTNAAREGARVGVLDDSTAGDVTNAVTRYLSAAGINNPEIDCDPPNPSSQTYGQPVTVTISIPFSQVSWLPSPMFLGGKVMEARSAMRRETVQ